MLGSLMLIGINTFTICAWEYPSAFVVYFVNKCKGSPLGFCALLQRNIGNFTPLAMNFLSFSGVLPPQTHTKEQNPKVCFCLMLKLHYHHLDGLYTCRYETVM